MDHRLYDHTIVNNHISAILLTGIERASSRGGGGGHPSTDALLGAELQKRYLAPPPPGSSSSDALLGAELQKRYMAQAHSLAAGLPGSQPGSLSMHPMMHLSGGGMYQSASFAAASDWLQRERMEMLGEFGEYFFAVTFCFIVFQ
jgi:hypothetical protein